VAGTGEAAPAPRLGAVGPLQPGDPRQVGRYLLSGRLGAGGMGTVYLGRAAGPGGGRPVAVKVVHPELAGDPEFRARFADEVAAARRVAPFCTARVLDADPAARPPWLVTEYVDGVPLGTAVADGGPLDPSTLHGVALGVAAALAAVHAAGVVHRDLKPSNVLLSLSGPRVIDFGIAQALDVARAHTQVGMLVGTPGWMAPEQFRAHGQASPVGPASDVFSWGSLVAYAATGRNPWGTAGGLSLPPAEQAQRILAGAPDLAGLGGPLRGLVERALAKDPARRPSARQLVDELLGGAPGSADSTVAASQLVERTWIGLPAFGGPPGQPGRPGPTRPPGPGGSGQPGRPGAAVGPGAAGPTVAAGSAPTRVLPPQPRGGAQPDPTHVLPAAPAAPARRRLSPTRLRRGAPAPGAPPPGAPLPYTAPPPTYRVEDPPRRRRRWWRRKRLLIPLGLLVLLVFLPERDPVAPAREPGLGQPVRDGQLEFVVRDVRCGVRQLGDGPLARSPSGQFCLARVDVRNVKQDARTLFEPFQKLHDSAGEKHGADVSARLYYRDQTLWDQVRPGQSVRGTMVFDIPADRQAVALELHDGIASGGVTVQLR
jgi:hypothetical protein